MSWNWGVERLPDGTYVDRPRPARHYFVIFAVFLTPFWLFGLLIDFGSPLWSALWVGVATAIAGLYAWNGCRVVYEINGRGVEARAVVTRWSVEHSRIERVRSIVGTGKNSFLTNRWTDLVVIETGWWGLAAMVISPTNPEEFIAELERRIAATPRPPR